jgi:hypothetical protein
MKKKSTSLSAFFDFCVLIALVVFLADVFLALFGFGVFSNAFAQAKVSARGSTELSSGGVTSETIELQQIASSLTHPVPVPHAGDGTGRLFIEEQTGKIRILRRGTLSLGDSRRSILRDEF